MLRPKALKRPVFRLKANTALRSTEAAYRAFLEHDRATPDEIQRLQDERSLAMARFAVDHTAFYAERYREAGIRRRDLRDPAVLRELPTVTKADVRARFHDFVSDEAAAHNTATNVTGGSTGEPLRVLRDLRVPSRALEWRLFHWWGIDPSVDIALVQRHTKTPRESRRHNLTWWPSTRFQLDAFRMDEASVDEFIARWKAVRPGLLIGYAGAIAELALIVDRRNLCLPAPHAVAVTAAPLTAPQRHAISTTFRAPVYDHYRSSEIPWIAGECSAHQGLHVFADVRRVDILSEDGMPAPAGQVGDVVVTDLSNRVFPMIRYRLGDRSSAIRGTCACGVRLPRIAQIQGRDVDSVRLPTGRVVAGEGLAQIFSKAPDAVRQFQIHQYDDYSVVLKYIPTDHPDSAAAVGRVSEALSLLLDSQVPLQCQRVNSIPHIGGKVRCVVSDIS